MVPPRPKPPPRRRGTTPLETVPHSQRAEPNATSGDGGVLRSFASAVRGWFGNGRRLPLYAILLPITPILYLFSFNYLRISIAHFLNAASIMAVGYLILRQFLRWCLPARAWIDPVLAVVFVVLAMKAPLGFASSSNTVWVLSIAVLVTAFTRVPMLKDLVGFTLVVITALPLTVFTLQVVLSPLWSQRADITDRFEASLPPIEQPSAAGEERPDIYYIVLDRYARADQLLEKHGFDNAAFLDQLSDAGFRVMDQFFANYQRTAHSLASTLNMDYLDVSGEIDDSFDWVPLYRRITDTRLNAFLEEREYEFHFMGTWWEPTRRHDAADYLYNYRAWPELLRVAFENSLMGEAVRKLEFGMLAPRTLQCQRVKYKFDVLGRLPDVAGPKFVFAHFLVPHPPFVLDAAGNCMGVAETLARTRQENYVGQIRFANDRILDFVREVFSRPGPKPIIVLQSDEGPWPEPLARDEVLFLGRDVSGANWLDVPSDLLREKMGILNAVYMPGRNTDQIPSSFTPVNTFRIILREYFDVPIDPLPDRNFVFEDNRHIYRFHDVTSVLRADPVTVR